MAAGGSPQPVQQLSSEPAPILQEGRVQGCQGYLTKRSKILKRWKNEQRWFTITPGQDGHVFHKHGKSQKVVRALPAGAPGVTVEPLSDDPGDGNFLGFRLVSSKGKEKCRFRANDIVQMRRFMASLGGTCPGLFTKKRTEGVDAPPVGAMDAKWTVIQYSADELSQRQKCFNEHIQGKAVHTVPTYSAAISQLAYGFYFPPDVEVKVPPEMRASLSFSSSPLPVCEPIALPNVNRRPNHDTFRPPYGPPIFFPVSIGYGSEVGLQPGQQALWEPNLKTYFFVDHVNQATFYKDPRPPKEMYPAVKKVIWPVDVKEWKSTPNMVPAGCKDPQVIEASAKRALSKPHGYVLNTCGINGPNGAHGPDGPVGTKGKDGSKGNSIIITRDGGKGGNGNPGQPGTNGARGADGTRGSDVQVHVDGDANALQITGTYSFTANLGGSKAEEVLLVNCRGGNGGAGGRGGKGGHGGAGGRGGNGGRGQDAISAGGNGGDGGDGGTGGSGAAGGAGGKGGDGGFAAEAGSCVIRTYDAKLLVLIEANCLEGTPGKGGNGGTGGRGGDAGQGGCGGPGGNGALGATYEYVRGDTLYRGRHPSGKDGCNGRVGVNGHPGGPGKNGDHGIDGRPAAKGGILWQVYYDGKVRHEAPARFDAEVEKLCIVSAVDDGIFEPNEMIMVSEVLVVNSGGLPLPAGSSAFMPSTKTIKFQPTKYEVPELMPKHVVTIPVTYHGRIFDQPPPNVPGPFVSSAEFHPRIELLGRPFEKSFLHQKLTVQYPVKLAYLKCNENLGQGEVSTLEIGVQNISSMPYGDCPGSGGKVALQIHMDARIIPVGCVSADVKSASYTVTFDSQSRDSMYVQIHKIPPKKMVIVQVVVQMESRAELFDRCLWQADLYLRDKLIEYNFKDIRVAPIYVPEKDDADVLMITNQRITRKEFVLWQCLLEVLNVKTNFWDVDRYHGLSVDNRSKARHPASWLGRYPGKLILYPYCDLRLLFASDLVAHFHGPEYAKERLEEKDSGMVLIMHPHAPHTNHTDQFYDRGDNSVIRHLAIAVPPLELSEKSYSGHHFSKPKVTPYLAWEAKQMRKMEGEIPSQSAVVISRQTELHSTGFFRYSYGTVDIRRIPLLHSSKLLVLDGAGSNVANLSADDASLSPDATEFALASHFGQVLLATLYGLPLASKLSLVKMGSDEPIQLQVHFCLPSGSTLSKAELSMICAVAEIADEVLNCSGEALRMTKLVQDVTTNVEAYQANGQVVLRSMGLLKEELKVRKKRLNNPQISRTVSAIKDEATRMERFLQKAGVDSQNLPALPSFSILRDSCRVHHTAQHRFADGRWNLLGQ